MIKRRLIFSTIVLLVALIAAGGFMLQAAQAQTATPVGTAQTSSSSLRTITVSGTGRAAGQPDSALVMIGVQTDATTAADALTQNNAQMQALLDSLDQAGINQSDIQTQSVQIYPRYDSNPQPASGSPGVVGFTASNVVEVRVNDLDQVGAILTSSVAAGGNTIQGIYFEITDQDALYDQALESAMQDARRKADRLASLSGAQLGEIYSVTESSLVPLFASGRGGVVNQAGADVPIQPGNQDVTVTLQVTWLIESTGGIPSTGGTAQPTTPAATSTRRATSTPVATTTAAATSAATGTVRATSTPRPTTQATTGTVSPTAVMTGTATAAAPLSLTSLVDQLEDEGADVQRTGSISQPFFPVTGQRLQVDNGELQVFEFEDIETRETFSDQIAENSSFLGMANTEVSGNVNVWAEGRLLAIYVGSDTALVEMVSDVMGEPILTP